MTEQLVKTPETVIKQKKEIGRRFCEFRKLIGKTQIQLAKELDVYQSTITNIERGSTFPALIYIIYFHRNYNLNPTWLLCGEGQTFIPEDEIFKEPWKKSLLPCHIKNEDPMYENYYQLLNLMQIPFIEKVILGKLTELKMMAREEIKNFKKNNKK